MFRKGSWSGKVLQRRFTRVSASQCMAWALPKHGGSFCSHRWITGPSGLSGMLVSLLYFQGSGMVRYPPEPTLPRGCGACAQMPQPYPGTLSGTFRGVPCLSSSGASCTPSLPGGSPPQPHLSSKPGWRSHVEVAPVCGSVQLADCRFDRLWP